MYSFLLLALYYFFFLRKAGTSRSSSVHVAGFEAAGFELGITRESETAFLPNGLFGAAAAVVVFWSKFLFDHSSNPVATTVIFNSPV
jgi:hypothetical protein